MVAHFEPIYYHYLSIGDAKRNLFSYYFVIIFIL